jgi:hypothetical protein
MQIAVDPRASVRHRRATTILLRGLSCLKRAGDIGIARALRLLARRADDRCRQHGEARRACCRSAPRVEFLARRANEAISKWNDGSSALPCGARNEGLTRRQPRSAACLRQRSTALRARTMCPTRRRICPGACVGPGSPGSERRMLFCSLLSSFLFPMHHRLSATRYTPPMRATAHFSCRVIRSAAAFSAAAVLLQALGCSKPLLSPAEVRSQYDRYDRVRAEYAQQYVEDEFGRKKPNIRGRLSPKD